MYRLRCCLFVIVFCPMLVPVAHADRASDIVGSLSLLGAFDAVSASLTMRIERVSGTRERGMELFYRRNGKASDVLAQVVSPAFLSNMKFLRKDAGNGSIELYLKNSSGVRRVVGDRGDEALFDSDFRTGDFMASHIDKARVVEESAEIIVLEIQPGGKAAFSARRLTLRSADLFLLSFEELDQAGRLVRRYRVVEFGEAEGKSYARLSVMELPDRNQRTWLEVTGINTAPRFGASLFSRMSL